VVLFCCVLYLRTYGGEDLEPVPHLLYAITLPRPSLCLTHTWSPRGAGGAQFLVLERGTCIPTRSERWRYLALGARVCISNFKIIDQKFLEIFLFLFFHILYA